MKFLENNQNEGPQNSFNNSDSEESSHSSVNPSSMEGEDESLEKQNPQSASKMSRNNTNHLQTDKSTSSHHKKNMPSDVPLLVSSKVEPSKMKVKAANLKGKARSRTILPFHADGTIEKTPEGFNLNKFIEETQKKNEQITAKLEGTRKFCDFRRSGERARRWGLALIINKSWFWRVHDKKRIYWDLFIMLFALWNSIQIPFSIAFNEDQDQSTFNLILNLFVDSFFIADLFINFRTSYLDEESGEEIVSDRKIFIQYMKGNPAK